MNDIDLANGVLTLSTSTATTSSMDLGKYKSVLPATVNSAAVLTGTQQAGAVMGMPNNWSSVLTLIEQTPAGLSLSIDKSSPDMLRLSPAQPPQHTGSQAEVVRRAYPQVVEAAQPALRFISQALGDARAALEAFGEPDFREVANRLTCVAALCARAHLETRFNESFGAVVSYIRRATIAANAANPDEISRDSLNSLVHVLNTLITNPVISLGDAGDLVELLSQHGWHGEHEAIERIIATLLNNELRESATEASA
jgi:hypothetical protein